MSKAIVLFNSLANDLARIVEGHTGEVLCDAVVGCLKEFGIEKRVRAITCWVLYCTHISF